MAGFGGTVKLQGESEYRKALKEIQSSLRLVSSELKLTNSEFKNGDKNLNDTKNSYNNMNSAIKEQKEKVADLRKTVAQMSEQYGENNEKVKVFKTQLNNAENQLVKMENATDKNNSELKEMQNNLDNAGTSSIKFGDLIKANVISEAIISGVKALGSAMKQVGSAIIDMGKKSLEQYANYEQLVGGVDTLFKESSNKVQEYANNAYKTSGLSANEYMETVTSFSASLLQSLNGDTAKSAKVADMAIIDMSDNANKMGTDMSMIQSAYQGFAKQNYTMLDNLKLGYGGTKTEMQRLLADAEKVSGIKYDISNLNDVYQAIHVIQGELGITGTTAKEAETTIQGSISSLKSSWQNLLTGFANENADFSELINNLIDSLFTVADNVLPIVKNIAENIVSVFIPSLVQFINNNLPEILNSGVEILKSIINGIQENLPFIIDTAVQIINTIVKTLIEMLPQILEIGIQAIVELATGIAQSLPELIPTIVDTVLVMVETLLDNIDMIIDAGIQLMMGLTDGLINALPILIDKIPIIIDKLVNAITNNLPKLIEMGIVLTVKLAEGLVRAIPQLLSQIPQIITSLVNGMSQGIGQMTEVGSNLVKGLWQGILNVKDWILDKIKGFGQSVLNGIKDFFGIHSPSTLFRDEVGKYMAQGIGVGFTNEMLDVTKDMQNSIPTEFNASYDLNTNSVNSNDNKTELRNFILDIIKEYKPVIYLDKEVVGEFSFDYGNIKYGNLVSS